MIFTLKFYIQIEQYEKNMCEFFLIFMNFVSSYVQYMHDRAIYTG
jgi:hypothetical protein